MRKLPLCALGLSTLLLASCRNAPELTEVPVPDGAPILHGTYTGTLREGMNFQGAVLSRDQAHLYVVANASKHVTLLELQPATGQQLRRADLPLKGLNAFFGRIPVAERPDGKLVIAASDKSVAVDPATLQIVQDLPAANLISQDGTTLLALPSEGNPTYRQYDSATGSLLLSRTLLWHESVSTDMNWVANGSAQQVTNLRTGTTIDVSSGHLDPCKRTAMLVPPVLKSIEAVPGGLFLAYDDGTLEWRDQHGAVQKIQKFDLPCTVSQGPASPPRLNTLSAVKTTYDDGKLMFFVAWNDNSRSYNWFGEVTLEGGPVIQAELGNADVDDDQSFGGTFAFWNAGQPLLHHSAQGSLRRWQVWKTPELNASFPIALTANASYVDETSYALRGAAQTPAGEFAFTGQGKVENFEKGPKIRLTPQVLCGDPLFDPCPTLGWNLKLTSAGQEVGTMSSIVQAPLPTGGRAVQSGTLTLNWAGENRVFAFKLAPQSSQ